MLGDSLGDARVFAVIQRIIAANHALKLREFSHHSSRQVGLGEAGSPANPVYIGVESQCEVLGD